MAVNCHNFTTASAKAVAGRHRIDPTPIAGKLSGSLSGRGFTAQSLYATKIIAVVPRSLYSFDSTPTF
jgi:hypothetical protein